MRESGLKRTKDACMTWNGPNLISTRATFAIQKIEAIKEEERGNWECRIAGNENIHDKRESFVNCVSYLS
jgi:hypothetical protein